MTVLVACDLDGTLIYSVRALGGDVGADLTCVELLDGEPASYLMSSAAATLRDLSALATIVPVSVRSPAQLARVRLPGASRYAIAANGGRLFVDGAVDSTWSRRVASLVADQCSYPTMREHVTAVEAQGWLHRAKGVEELFCYGIVDLATLPDGAVDHEAEYAAAVGWRVSLQGRKLYWVPSGLDKATAVGELADRLGAVTVLAAGDSGLDAELLRTASRGIRPAHGELHRAGWTAPRVDVTAATGVDAGAEIVDWLMTETRSALATLPLLAPAAEQQQDDSDPNRGVTALRRQVG